MKQTSCQRTKIKKKIKDSKEKKTEPQTKKINSTKVKKHKNTISTTRLRRQQQHQQSFKGMIKRFKKAFDQKLSFVKDDSQHLTQRPFESRKGSKKNYKVQNKQRDKGISQILNSMEVILNKPRVNNPNYINTTRDKKKNKIEKSKEKSREMSKSRQKSKSRAKSINKSVPISAFKKMSIKKSKKNVKTLRINTQNQNQKTTKRIRLEDFEYEKSDSVIVHEISEDQNETFEKIRNLKAEQENVKFLENYICCFIKYLKYSQKKQQLQREEKTKLKIKEELFEKEHNQAYNSTVLKVQDIFKLQKLRWLKMKESIEKLKNVDQVSLQIDDIISQAQSNFKALQNMEVKDSRHLKFESEKVEPRVYNFDITEEEQEKKNQDDISLSQINIISFDIKSSQKSEKNEDSLRIQQRQLVFEKNKQVTPQRNFYILENQIKKSEESKRQIDVEGKNQKRLKKLSYEQAPCQIKKIFKEKRKSEEEIQKQQLKKTKQLNQQKLRQELDLMDYISENSSFQNKQKVSDDASDSLSRKPKIKICDDFFKKQSERKKQKGSIIFKKEKNKSSEKLLKEEEDVEKKKSEKNSDTLLLSEGNSPQLIQNCAKEKQQILEQEQVRIEEIEGERQEKIKKIVQIITKNDENKEIGLSENTPVTPTSINVHKISFSPYAEIEDSPQNEENPQPFILSKPKYTHSDAEQCQVGLIQDLVQEMIFELNLKMANSVKKIVQAPNIQIYYSRESYNGNEPTIQCNQTFSLLATHNMLQFMKNLPNQQFRNRVRFPLGLKSRDMLAVLRKIRHGISNDEEEEFEQSNYHSIIDIEHITNFQLQITDIQSDYNYTGYQQYFDQAIFDAMNIILDELRPFGKHGYPPICFQDNFKAPSHEEIYKRVMNGMKQILSVRLGMMHFEIDSDRIMRQSLDKFKKQCVREFDDEWLWQKQGQFQIFLEIMNELEEHILLQEVDIIAKTLSS